MTTATRSSGSKQRSTGRSSQSQRSGSRQTRSQATSSQSQKQSAQGRSSGQSSQKSQTTQKSQATTSTTAQSRSRSGSRSSGTTVHLPFVTAQFHAPEMHVPGRQEISSAANSAVEQAGSAVNAVREQMPSRDRALFYGALGGAAALSVIEWPVALAIGVGTALVSRGKTQSGTR